MRGNCFIVQKKLYAYNPFLNQEYDYNTRVERLDKVSFEDVHKAIDGSFDIERSASATVGPKRTALKY